jgi:hypothetical protein
MIMKAKSVIAIIAILIIIIGVYLMLTGVLPSPFSGGGGDNPWPNLQIYITNLQQATKLLSQDVSSVLIATQSIQSHIDVMYNQGAADHVTTPTYPTYKQLQQDCIYVFNNIQNLKNYTDPFNNAVATWTINTSLQILMGAGPAGDRIWGTAVKDTPKMTSVGDDLNSIISVWTAKYMGHVTNDMNIAMNVVQQDATMLLLSSTRLVQEAENVRTTAILLENYIIYGNI